MHFLALGILSAIVVTLAKGEDAATQSRCVAAFFLLISAPVFMKAGHILSTHGPTRREVVFLVEVLVMLLSGCEVFHFGQPGINRSIPEARTIELEQEVMNQDIINWTPPPLEMMNTMLKPYYCLFKVDCIGLERIPNTFPCFYVMNHSLYGLEMPSLVHLLYSKKGVFVRGLADHSHWMGPHGPLLRQCGAVDGSRPNVDLLMANKQSPGSAPVHGVGFILQLVGLMVQSLKKR